MERGEADVETGRGEGGDGGAGGRQLKGLGGGGGAEVKEGREDMSSEGQIWMNALSDERGKGWGGEGSTCG